LANASAWLALLWMPGKQPKDDEQRAKAHLKIALKFQKRNVLFSDIATYYS
jgi:hypothetical protein